jgi:hypothetical protein
VPLLVYTFRSDLDGANGRCKLLFREMAVKHNRQVRCGDLPGHGYVVIFDMPCLKHILVRGDSYAFQKTSLTCKLHATAFCFFQPKIYRDQVAALKLLIRKDLKLG